MSADVLGSSKLAAEFKNLPPFCILAIYQEYLKEKKQLSKILQTVDTKERFSYLKLFSLFFFYQSNKWRNIFF